MSDLTIIYLTANELPQHWMRYQLEVTAAAAGDIPVVAVVRKPVELPAGWGTVMDDGKRGYWNIYQQILRVAKTVTTPFVATAEDDVLYTPEHFREYRPASDNVAFNRSRWSVFAWDADPVFSLRQRVSNCAMIASREYLVDCLEERARRWPNGPEGRSSRWVGEVGRGKVFRGLQVTVRKEAEEFWGSNPIVHLNHLTGTDVGEYGINRRGRRMVKQHGQVKAVKIPCWGTAMDVVRRYARD